MLKEKLKNKVLLGSVTGVSVLSVPTLAFAEETSSSSAITSAFTTWATGLVSDITSSITSILPGALTVVGIGILVTIGIKTFKKVASK